MFITVKKIRYINILCLLSFILILSTVLVINTNLYDYTLTGKYFWYYITMGCVCFSTLVSYIFNRKRVNFCIIDLAVALLLICGFIVSYNTNNDATTKLILFILLSCLYFFLRIFLSQEKMNGKILIIVFLFLGFIEAIWGLCQLYGYTQSFNFRFKITGSLYNPGPYAGYLAMVMPVAVYYLVKDRGIIKQRFRKRVITVYLRWIISALTFSAIIMILPATMSRASWVAASGSCLIVLLFILFRENNNYIEKIRLYLKQHRTICILYLCGFMLITSIAFVGIYYLKKDSADGRLFMWKIAAQTILHHPYGVGIGNFSGSYGNQQIAYFTSGQGTEKEKYVSGCPDYAFNEYLQIGIELGIVGLLLFLAIIGIALYTGIKNRKIMAVGSLSSLLLFACMSYPFNLLPFLIVLVFMLSLCVTNESKKKFVCPNINMKLTYCLFFVSTIILFICLYNRYPTYKAYKDWKIAKSFLNYGIPEENAERYARLKPYLSDQVGFLLEYAGCLSALKEYDKSNIELQKAGKICCDPIILIRIGKNYQTMKSYKKAEQYYLQAAYTIPSRYYPIYLLAKLYMETGEKDKAQLVAKALLEKVPKIDSPAIQEMKAEMKTLLSGEQRKESEIAKETANL